MGKKLIGMALALSMILAAFGLGIFIGCESSKKYTIEEHIQRISERVESRFFLADSEYSELYTDYTVTLLYNAKDEPAYFMVEFNPDGFLYGIIDKGNYYFDYGGKVNTLAGISVWRGGSFFRGSQWGDAGEGWWLPEGYSFDSQWINYLARCPSIHDGQDEWNYRSHFDTANVGDEKKYMAFSYYAKSTSDFIILALVKHDDTYVCVVSGQEYESAWFEQVSKKGLTRNQRNSLSIL